MYSSLDFEKEINNLRQHGRNFDTLNELKDELKIEWLNMHMYASDNVIKSTHSFMGSGSV